MALQSLITFKQYPYGIFSPSSVVCPGAVTAQVGAPSGLASDTGAAAKRRRRPAAAAAVFVRDMASASEMEREVADFAFFGGETQEQNRALEIFRWLFGGVGVAIASTRERVFLVVQVEVFGGGRKH